MEFNISYLLLTLIRLFFFYQNFRSTEGLSVRKRILSSSRFFITSIVFEDKTEISISNEGLNLIIYPQFFY